MKYLYSILTVVLFSIGFAASEESEESKIETANLCGTYIITDENNVTYSIIINDDRSVTAKGNGQEYYGSWSKIGGKVCFQFSGEFQERPSIMFKEGDLRIANEYQISDDGFIYGDAIGRGNPRSRNPQFRLKYRKTN